MPPGRERAAGSLTVLCPVCVCPAAGTRYLFLEGEPGVFLSCKRAAVGLYARQTDRVAIAALYQDPATPQQCAACVTSLCRYLSNKGF